MKETTNSLISFIKNSPSAFHAVSNIAKALSSEGYTELTEASEWRLEGGKGYYVTRNLSSVIAFRLPKSMPSGYMITAAHSDSPSFKIKEVAEADAASRYTRINVEKYGGMICSTWLDRPLSAAGRVVFSSENGIETKLVDLERELFMIPSVAIHMNRNTNENASYNPATDMQPISGSTAVKGSYKKMLAEQCGCSGNDILSSDMFLYCRDEGKIWGASEEFVSAPRIDDLQCAFSALCALVEADKETSACRMLAVFDNEEVGSGTKQGAAATFLKDTIMRINEALGGNYSTYASALASSFMISADNAHAVHPNHPEYADANHRPIMNGGIVIKHNANQRYTTDAVSSAVFTKICKKAGVPIQHYTNRPDIAGGSTLGNISSSQVAVNTVDIGLPQLSMHSAYETAGVNDTLTLIKALKVFYDTELVTETNGNISIK